MNLLDRRRVMCSAPVMNNTYTEVEYLRAEANEFIDTGIYPTMSMEIEIVFTPYSISTTQFICSSRYAWRDRDISIRSTGLSIFYDQESYTPTVTTTGIKYRALFSNTAVTEPIWARKAVTIIRMDTGERVRSQYLYLENTAELGSEYSIYMFGCNNAGTYSFLANANIYSMVIKNDGEVVRDFIPVLDYYNVPCMYDKVSDSFFYGVLGNGFTYG